MTYPQGTPPPTAKLTQVEFEKFRLMTETRVTKEAMQFVIDPVISFIRDDMGEELRIQMEQFVYGKQLTYVEEKWPEDWWQAVKDRFAPAWFLRRWPVKYHTLTVDVKALFPTIPDPGRTHIGRARILVEGRRDGLRLSPDDYKE